MNNNFLLNLSALFAGSLISFSAHSAIINITFEGTTVESCTTCLGSGLNAVATYSIDTDHAFNSDGDLNFLSASFSIDGHTYDITQPPGSIYRGTPGEIDSFRAELPGSITAYNDFYGYFDLDEDGGDAISSSSFIWNPYDGSDMTYSGDFTLTGNFYGNAHITLLDGGLEAHYETHTFSVSTVSTVPVPAAVWLFSSGLIGLIGISRRKKPSK